ncbi:hypothetical protein INR49_013463 [Caranx melampygus]|nr:hypothetical protein INR49_013463 [Caranx melampygus]
MSPPSRRLQTKPVITCLKTFLISYSLIFWFTGVILLAVGVWGKVSLEAYFSLASDESTNAPYVLIGTGATIVIFGLFGCFATCRGSPWMLKLYAMFLTLVFLAELVAGISGFIFRHEIKAKLGKAYDRAVDSYNSTDGRSAVDTIQRTGCFSLVTHVMEANLGIIAGISFGIAFFQVTDRQLLVKTELNESPVIFNIVCVSLVIIILEREKHSPLPLLFSLTNDKQAEGNCVKDTKG